MFSSVTAQISDSFTKTVGDAIFSGFYKVGVELEKALPSIFSMEKQLFELEKALPMIEDMGQKAIELEGKIPEIHQKGQQIIALEQRIPELDAAGQSILRVESKLPFIKEAGDEVLALQDKITSMQRTTNIINEVQAHINEVEINIKQTLDQAKASLLSKFLGFLIVPFPFTSLMLLYTYF